MKSWHRKWCISLILLAALTGCSLVPSHPNITKVSLPPQPIVKDEFSLLPLNEDGWIMASRGSDVLLGARGTVPGETRVITGFVRPLPANMTDEDFLTFAKSVKKMDGPPSRLEVLKQEAQKDGSTGKDCVKVRTTLKDSVPHVVTKNPAPMIIDSLYWVCKHPDGEKAVIVEYSDRFYAGDEEKDFEKNAETVFHGFEFVTHQ